MSMERHFPPNWDIQQFSPPKEEEIFVDHCLALAALGFPLGPMEIRHMAQGYLNQLHCSEPMFCDNLPGHNWCFGLVERHKD